MRNPYAITAIESASPTAPLLLRCPCVEAVVQAAALGFQGLELHVIEAAGFPAAAVKAACAAHGIAVSAIVTGQIFTRRQRSICSPDISVRDAAMAELRDYIDLAAELGAAAGVVIGWVKGDCGDDPCAHSALLSSQLRLLGEYGSKRGQRILVEVINRYETNVFNTCDSLKHFIEDNLLENVYIHLDTFHMNIEEPNLAEAILQAGPLLGYLHLADSNRRYLGSGHLDMPAVMAALRAANYRGYLSLECIPWPDGETAARKSLAILDSCMCNGI